MKYSEFEKLMEDKGLSVDKIMNPIRVRGGKRFGVVATIDTEYPGVYGVYYEKDCPWKLHNFIAQKSHELAFTDLESREEEQLFYLKQRGVPSRYLQKNQFGNFTTDIDIENGAFFKTKFTQKEIDQMPECYTHLAVWKKVPVKEEEQC